jgi:hypothetical protein
MKRSSLKKDKTLGRGVSSRKKINQENQSLTRRPGKGAIDLLPRGDFV